MIAKSMDFIRRHTYRGSFGANVLTLMIGSIIAYGMQILVSPALTRIYTPKEFGIFTIYTSIASIIAIIATVKYEIALVLPEKDEDALNIMALAAVMIFSISFFVWIIFWLFNAPISNLIGSAELAGWLYILPLTVTVISFYQLFNYWLIRKKKYKRLSINRVIQSVIIIMVNLVMGFFRMGVSGLILGVIFGQGITSGILAWQIWKENREKFKFVKKEEMLRQGRQYLRFPLYTFPATAINVTANQFPNILLNSFFGPEVTGFFGLTQRVLAVPIAFVGASISDVFKERASSDYRKYGNCKSIYTKTLKSLFLFSLAPFLLFFFFAPSLFTFVFGQQWRPAGEYAQIMSVLFFLSFTSSPLSYTFFIAQKQNYDLIWQAVLLIATTASIAIGGYQHDVKLGLFYFSMSYSLMYIICLLFSYRYAQGNTREKGKAHDSSC